MIFLNQDEITYLKGPGYTAQVHIDQTNERLWVISYSFRDAAGLVAELNNLSRRHKSQKVVFPCEMTDAESLMGQGFHCESEIHGFFRGRTAAILTLYPSADRENSAALKKEQSILKTIMLEPPGRVRPLEGPWELQLADSHDAETLASLFGTVFVTYPTPVDDPAYLQDAMRHGSLFAAAKYEGHTAAAAAAETDPLQGNAEITDCATLPEYRGKGLGTALVMFLEEECNKVGYSCLYGLARANQPGANKIFYRLGYHYEGILLQDVRIGGSGGYEDLNVWVKNSGVVPA